MGVGKNIRLLRTDKAISQLELAAQLGVENWQLSRIELEKELPTRELVTDAARIFNMKYEDLAYGTFVVKMLTEQEEEDLLDEGERG